MEELTRSTGWRVSKPDPDQAPIFIVGSGRSGTTLLRLMLNAHPKIYIAHEASFYLGSQFVPHRATTSDWLETYSRSLFFAWLGVDPEDVRAELACIHPLPVPRQHLPDAYRAIMRCCARRYQKCRYGDKTPLHSNYLKEIYRDFPDARVIHIVRDPRATIHSLCSMPWAPGSVFLNSRYYRRQIDAISKFADRILEIRLEDVLLDREAAMRLVLNFIGEDWHECVLDHTHYAPLGDMPPYPWLEGASKAIRQSPPDWQKGLTPIWINHIQRTLKDIFLRYGYETAELNPQPEFPVESLAILRELPEACRFAARFAKLIRNLSGRYPANPEEIQKMMMKLNPAALKRFADFRLPQLASDQCLNTGLSENRA